MDVSRDTFYRFQELAAEDGVEALINKSRRASNFNNRVAEATEQTVVNFSLAEPAHGQQRISNELRKQGIFVSGSGVRPIRLRDIPENFKKTSEGIGSQNGTGRLDTHGNAIRCPGKETT